MKRGLFLSVLRNFGGFFLWIADRLDDEVIANLKWRQDRGDKTHRLDYDLNENSVVFDLGGYEGQWSSDIFSRYCCNIYIFEPVTDFADLILKRFKKNPKIRIFHFGLAERTHQEIISVNNDASSIFSKKTGKYEEITLIRASEFIKQNSINHIDLMKINIEGGEYHLLEHLIESGLISTIDNIQVQFHEFIPDAEKRMEKIQNEMIKTHYLTYQYKFVFENWKRYNL